MCLDVNTFKKSTMRTKSFLYHYSTLKVTYCQVYFTQFQKYFHMAVLDWLFWKIKSVKKPVN